MENTDQLTNNSIKETIKDILYKEWTSCDFFNVKSVNYSLCDYGINLFIFEKEDVIYF